MDLFFRILCTESFHLKVDSTGLKTHRSEKADAWIWAETEKLRAKQRESERLYLPSVLWARLQGDGARQVQRNLRTHAGTGFRFCYLLIFYQLIASHSVGGGVLVLSSSWAKIQKHGNPFSSRPSHTDVSDAPLTSYPRWIRSDQERTADAWFQTDVNVLCPPVHPDLLPS